MPVAASDDLWKGPASSQARYGYPLLRLLLVPACLLMAWLPPACDTSDLNIALPIVAIVLIASASCVSVLAALVAAFRGRLRHAAIEAALAAVTLPTAWLSLFGFVGGLLGCRGT